MSPLTPKLKEIMLFIQRTVAQTGHAPTIKEIVTGCALSSKSRAHDAVNDLCTLGHLGREIYGKKQASRGLTILKPIPDDRFEEAAKAVCDALGRDLNPDNVSRAREAIFNTLMGEHA